MEEMLSTKEAARRLGVSPSRLSRAVWAGNVQEPTRGPGGAFCWTAEDLERASWALLSRPLTPEAGR